MRKSVIIIQDILKVFSSEIFSNMKIACDRMGWPYSYVKRYRIDMEPFIRDLRLLTIEEMRILFPDSQLLEEHLLGFIKSIIAYRC